MNTLKKPSPTWYKEIWTLAIQDMSWVGHTINEVDFITDIMELTGSERILDLACGYGRHAIELSKRGFSVVGVDITPDFIKEAEKTASAEKLNAKFICSDLRDVSFKNEFDVVLNMGDGAIGYLENDDENLKIFDLIASSLKKGGKHFMDIINAEHAEMHLPKKVWDIGEKMLSIEEFHWDKETRRLLDAGWAFRFGEIAKRPAPSDIVARSSIRLYSLGEIEEIFKQRQMVVRKTFGNSFGEFNKNVPASHREMQLLVYSQKI